MNKKNILKIAAVAVATVVTTGIVFAQSHGFGPGFGHRGRMMEFVAGHLDLTDAQKAQAKQIFDTARSANEPYLTQARQIAEQAHAAIKAGKSEGELQQIANSGSTVAAQIMGTHLKAMSKFYTILTPEQKEKADKLHSNMKSRFQQHFQHQREVE